MSQYGHHSHYQSSVGSDKPWDIVAAAAAAAAANVNNVKSANGGFGFPNGFQSINGGGNNGNNLDGNYLNNGAAGLGSFVPQSSPSWQQDSASLLYAANQSQCSTWADQQQQQRHAQQQQVLQQAHQQAQLLSAAGAPNFFPGHLTSTTSPLTSRTTGWSKLPHALISVGDESLSSPVKFEPPHPQQSSAYLPRYNVAVSAVPNASYGGLLTSVSSSTLNALNDNPAEHQSSSYSSVGGSGPPLYHSSLELEMLRTIANSSKSTTIATKMSPSFSSPSHGYAPSSDGARSGINPSAAALSAYFSTSSTIGAQPRVKLEPSSSPRLDSNELEAAKTMLSIQTNLSKENSSVLNCGDYQQISPAVSEISNATKHQTSSPDEGGETTTETSSSGGNCSSNKSENILATSCSSQYSRDDARAQQNTDVPIVVMNNDESSSTQTSAKCTQEVRDKRGVDKEYSAGGTPYNHHRLKCSQLIVSSTNSSSSSSEKLVINENVSDPPRDNFTSGVSVVSRNCSAQGNHSSVSVTRNSDIDVTLSPPPASKPLSDGGSGDSSRSPIGELRIVSPAPTNSTSRNASGGSSNNPISGYGLQAHATLTHGTVYNCNMCKFSSTSRFHFNSHMNTHADHKCTVCDYTSRTEGRLKRHMKDCHTHSNNENSMDFSQDFDDSGGRCSPPSPDENTALVEKELMAVVSSVAHHSSDYDGANASTKDKQPAVGKSKTYRCKQCTFVANSKTEFWLHQKSAHIKGDRVLACPRCLFVTEYKHHLEYHLRNHFGSKPFKCTKCNYSCVNKSMLNSHMKSHSNFYQYRCDDCTYATKYCHSLKMHLRKYGHRPATVVSPDGMAAEPAVIDVYGNRRGPRTKKSNGVPNSSNAATVPSITALLPPITVPSAMNGATPTQLNPLMEALQNSYLKQQQDITTAMVTSIATLGAQLPTVPSFIQRSESNLIEENSPIHPTPQYLKCSLCDFETADGKEVLTIHVMSHIMKNKNLCGLYNFSSEVAPSGSVSASSSNSTPNDQFSGSTSHLEAANARCLSSTPKDDQRSRSNSFAARFGAETASPVRISPSQDLSQDSNSPASASCEKHSGDESFGGQEITPHIRRRKGKAYKLDKIALRLQERMSPNTNSSKDEESEIVSTVDNAASSGHVTDQESANNARNKQSHSPTPMIRVGRSEAQTLSSVPVLSNSSENNSTLENYSAAADRNHHQRVNMQPTDIDWSNAYVCSYCEIAFKDCIMYTIHMGYHGFRDPFKCNMCGHDSDGRLSMFLHIARAPHP